MLTSPLTLASLSVHAAQFVFYCFTLATVILALRRFGPILMRKTTWGREEILLVLILGIPRAALALTIALNGNERGGDAMTYLTVAWAFPSSHLQQASGYPYLLGIGLRILSGHFHADAYAIMILQHGVGLLTALLLFRWLRPASRFQAWFTTLGWGLLSSTIFSEHVTRPEFFVTFLLCLTCRLLTRYVSSRTEGDDLIFWAGIA